MARKYELKDRAKSQEETRQRIVEAAIELHGTVGPARTTVSAIADRAGVQRHTYYRHFPDERSLAVACSGLYYERDPLPDPEPWLEIQNPEERLRRGLDELYAYYARNEPMLANVIRDAEVDPLTREMAGLRVAPRMAEIRQILSEGVVRGRRHRRIEGALGLALDFHTWRSLLRDSGLSQADAVDLMVDGIVSAADR
jgi:AcrR family transcriptional regulator